MRRYIPHCIIAVLLIFIIYQCESGRRKDKSAKANYDALTDTVRVFKNKLGSHTASIKTLQMEKSDLKNIIIKKDKDLQQLAKEFSEVKSIVKYETVTRFDTIHVAYRDTVPCVFSRSGEKAEDWYSFTYLSDQNGFTIDSLRTWTETTIITGYKRKWFLGKETLTTDITNSNPYITVNQIKSAEVVVPVPWWKKWYVWGAAGLIGGFVIAK